MYGHKIEGYKKAAKTVSVATRTVRSWVQDYEATQFIAESRRGRHSKTSSPILEDLEFREEFKEHVRQTSREQGKLVIFLVQAQCMWCPDAICSERSAPWAGGRFPFINL